MGNIFYLQDQTCDNKMTSSVLQNGNWQDRTCDERHGFICMKHSSPESTGDEVYVDIGCKLVSRGSTFLFQVKHRYTVVGLFFVIKKKIIFIFFFTFKKGWKRHGSYCYFVGTGTKNFNDAKADCEATGSYLADVSNG